jgi:hypothetical protein
MQFNDGASHCVCDLGYHGDACGTLWAPPVPDPCVPQQLLVSGGCDHTSEGWVGAGGAGCGSLLKF